MRMQKPRKNIAPDVTHMTHNYKIHTSKNAHKLFVSIQTNSACDYRACVNYM